MVPVGVRGHGDCPFSGDRELVRFLDLYAKFTVVTASTRAFCQQACSSCKGLMGGQTQRGPLLWNHGENDYHYLAGTINQFCSR